MCASGVDTVMGGEKRHRAYRRCQRDSERDCGGDDDGGCDDGPARQIDKTDRSVRLLMVNTRKTPPAHAGEYTITIIIIIIYWKYSTLMIKTFVTLFWIHTYRLHRWCRCFLSYCVSIHRTYTRIDEYRIWRYDGMMVTVGVVESIRHANRYW